MTRSEFVQRYREEFPQDEFSEFVHAIVSDENTNDGILYSAIANVAKALSVAWLEDGIGAPNRDREQFSTLRRQFAMLLAMLDLPDDEDMRNE